MSRLEQPPHPPNRAHAGRRSPQRTKSRTTSMATASAGPRSSPRSPQIRSTIARTGVRPSQPRTSRATAVPCSTRKPEMRKFLAGFAKKSLEDSVATAMRKAAEPEMIAWRKHVAAVLIDRRVAEALWSLDDARGKALIATLEGALYDVMTHATTRQLVLEALRETSRQTAGQSLRAIAARHGVAIPNLEPAFAAAWPAAQRALGAEGVLSALGRFIDATHEAWLAARSES